MPDAAPTAITELKVSAHLMRLAEGVFCVFNAPGTAGPDAASGLPGVRISPAPAMVDGGGTVSISGFNGDGWLGSPNDAALIRVSGGPAQVLVTVYQEMDSGHAAPKLQVMRLTDAAAAPAPEPKPEPEPAPESPVPVEVAAHIYGVGDVGGRIGDWMGERGSKRWIEGFGLAPGAKVALVDVEYQAVLGRGWLSPWSEGGQFCGSRGMSLPILGLRIRLRGAAAQSHAIQVEATFVDGAAVGPVGDGEACEAPSLAALEAFRVTLSERAAAPAASPAPAKAARKAPARKPEPSSPAEAAAPAKPGKPAAPKPPGKRTPATTRRR